MPVTDGNPAAPILQVTAAELLAEHHLMECVLAALEKETQRLKGGGALEPAFWAGIVDFGGNFVHLCHRVKEEAHFFPTIHRQGWVPADLVSGLGKEHERAHGLTLSLIAGIEQGDWEKVLALCSMYLQFLRPHMGAEEQHLFRRALHEMPAETEQGLREAFNTVEVATIGKGGRLHYLHVAQRLCDHAGLPHPDA